MKPPPIWSEPELERERERAQEHFRQGRRTEPLELYLELFDDYRRVVEDVFEQTTDLARLSDNVSELLGDVRKLEVVRYLSGPPVSEDDLKTLIETSSLNANRLKSDPASVDRLLTFIQDWHDRRRFPWIGADREPSENERHAAILATTTILATRRLETMRRSRSKIQERLVATQLHRARVQRGVPREELGF